MSWYGIPMKNYEPWESIAGCDLDTILVQKYLEIGTYGEFPSFPSAVRVAKVFHRLPGNVTIPDYYWAELIHAQIQKPGLECTGSQARHSRWPVFLLFLPTFWYYVDILSTILAGTWLIVWQFQVSNVCKKCSMLEEILFKFSWAQCVLWMFFQLAAFLWHFLQQ